jgi:glycosyltransferase involved in cell wall biosynthesis
MHLPFTSSLVIATYNWPEALEACLKSVLQQQQMPDEIVIADDGSGNDTRQLIAKYKEIFTIPVVHVWHPDEGFKLAAIRNKANAKATGDYIIQIDGDLLLHKDFVKDHIAAAKQACFIGGSRVILNQALSAQLLTKESREISLFQKGVSNHLNGIHSSLMGKVLSRLIPSKDASGIRGCNMGYWKKDFIAVNGYNEAQTGWGLEDTDLVMRFYNSGLKRTYFKLRGIVYHLWHAEKSRDNVAANHLILQKTIREKAVRCENGVQQYLAANNPN